MKPMRLAIALIAAALLSSASADTHAPGTPRKFAVTVGAQAGGGHILRGATAPGGTLTVQRTFATVNADGSQVVQIVYVNATSQQVSTRTLFVDSSCTRVVDNLGNVVSATGPTSECSAATTFTGQLDTTIGSAASGGKLNL